MEYRAGLVPFLDQPFAFSGPDPHNAMLFYNFYFAITGLHALHMIIGLMVLLVMLVLTYRWREGARVARQVRIAGLYWAFVDIVWVLVYCSLYLLAVRGAMSDDNETGFVTALSAFMFCCSVYWARTWPAP